MPYLFLILSVLFSACGVIAGKVYNEKNENKDLSPCYNLLQMAAAFVCWAIFACLSGEFNINVLPYSLGFAFFFSSNAFFLIRALKTGSAAITSLFLNFSNIITSLYSVFFWGYKLSCFCIFGLIFAAISFVFCISEGKKDKKQCENGNVAATIKQSKNNSGFSVKWLIYALLAMITNSGCSIVQREQQIAFDYKFGNLCMAFATLFSCIFFLISFWLRKDKTQKPLKKTLIFPVSAGITNFALNLFVILLASSTFSPSFIYPVVGVGSILTVTVFSYFAFKEKITPVKFAGLFFGIVATVLLSI